MTELSVYRGDTKTFTLTFVDEDGVAIDITDWLVFFTVKKNEEDEDADAIISKGIAVHTSAVGGLSAIPLTSTDTNVDPRKYWYDVQIVKDTGSVITVMKNRFVVHTDITRRTSIE